MKVSLQFIADKAHVSKSLVSKILNDREVRVSQEKRDEILRLAKEYNYVANKMASSLRTKKTNTIGLIVPNIIFNYFGKLSYAVEKTARDLGYNVIICNTSEDVKQEINYLDMFRMGVVDGLLVCPTGAEAAFDSYQQILYHKFPVVFVDRYLKNVPITSVSTDNRQGGYMLTKELLAKGYRRIDFVGRRRIPSTSDQEERYKGYEEAMAEMGLKPESHYLYEDKGINVEAFKSMVKALPEALLLSTSWDIYELLKIFQPEGIVIPEDIEIAAFDRFYLPYGMEEDIELAKSIQEPLMIMEQNPYEIGQQATKLLINRIEGQASKPKKIYIQPDFNGREQKDE